MEALFKRMETDVTKHKVDLQVGEIVVITDERNAVYCYDGKKTYSINPPKVKIADKTGAGDAFSAGFVAGLIKNKPIDFCLNLGVKEAISTIKYLGAKNNLLRMKLR